MNHADVDVAECSPSPRDGSDGLLNNEMRMADRQEVEGSDLAGRLGNASLFLRNVRRITDGLQIKWLVKSLFSQQLKSCVAISEGLNLTPPTSLSLQDRVDYRPPSPQRWRGWGGSSSQSYRWWKKLESARHDQDQS